MPTKMLSTAIRRARRAMTTSVADPIQTVRQNYRIRRFRRGAGAARAHRDPHVRRGQRGGVVDAVADHGGWMQPLLDAHGLDLIGGNALAQHGVEIEGGADRLRGACPISRHHHDPDDARLAQHTDGPRRVGAQFVGEQQRADRPPFQGDKNDERRAPRRAPCRPARPFWNLAPTEDHVAGARAQTATLDQTPHPRAHFFMHVFRYRHGQAPFDRRLNDRGGQDVMRGLF